VRKGRLAELLAKAPAGIQYIEHLEGDGAAIFAHACRLGAEGIVSKRRDHPYRAGPSKAWLKTKKPRGAGPIAFPGSGVTMPRDAQKAFLEHEDVMELLRLEIARAGSQGRWQKRWELTACS
jgi:hypothetical protein